MEGEMKVKLKKRYSAIIIAIIAVVGVAGAALAIWPSAPQQLAALWQHQTRPAQTTTTAKVTSQKALQKPQQPPFIADYALPPAENGLAPVITSLPTKQNIVFLGIDDGAFKDPSVVQLMKKNNIKASLFLSRLFIANNPDFFKQLVTQGSVVEDHTLSHDTNMIKDDSYAVQKAEICGMADYEAQHYGRRPILFRPPGGAYSTTMRKAAHDCGMKAVVTWIAKVNGGSMQYQVGDKLRPGDIVLMHFRPEFEKDMQAFVDAEKAAGVHTELLESAPGVM